MSGPRAAHDTESDLSTILIHPSAEPPIIVGRGPQCGIRIDHPSVAQEHAMLTHMGEGTYQVRPLSKRRLFLNSKDHEIQADALVGPADVLILEEYRLPIDRVAKLAQQKKQSKASAVRLEPEVPYPLPNTQITVALGRTDRQVEGTNVKVVIDHPSVADHHASVFCNNGQFFLQDTGSATGTYVNGHRAPPFRKVKIDEQSRILLGGCQLALVRENRSGLAYRLQWNFALSLRARSLSVAVTKRKPGLFGMFSRPTRTRIVNNINFTINPTEFVGLMGPSGSGKTSLLEALNGNWLPSEGESLVNGVDLHTNLSQFRDMLAYVPQDDILYPNLTVEESVRYTARLRLPRKTRAPEIERLVTETLRSLKIEQIRGKRIGSAEQKVISGGERKRVSIAHEIIMKPALLFLDEPTSGLSAEDAANVMGLLRDLTGRGTTIVVSIHQPSSEIYRKLDNVVYLLLGNVIYYGPAHPDSFFFFNGPQETELQEAEMLADPANVMRSFSREQNEILSIQKPKERRERLTGLAKEYRDRFEKGPTGEGSSYYQQYVVERAAEQAATAQKPSAQQQGPRKPRDPFRWLRQWGLLTERLALNKWRDSLNFWIMMAQAPVIGLMIAFVYGAYCGKGADFFQRLSQGPSSMFVLVTAAVWFGCSNSAREIVAEKAIYKRERMVNLSIGSYVLSKCTVLGTICAIQSFLLLGTVRVVPWLIEKVPQLSDSLPYMKSLGVALNGSFGLMSLTLILCSWAGLGMGLLVSALVRSGEAAVAFVPLLLIPQIVFGGITAPVHKMDDLPRAVSQLMVARWGFEAMMQAEYADVSNDSIITECTSGDSVGLDHDKCKLGKLSFLPADFNDVSKLPKNFDQHSPERLSTCGSYCLAMSKGLELSPLEKYFGVDRNDGRRRDFRGQFKDRDQTDPSHPSIRTGLKQSLSVLGAFILVLMLGVTIVLAWKDPRRWAHQA
jgi:ABC-type multidrug transport system ATPase subunit